MGQEQSHVANQEEWQNSGPKKSQDIPFEAEVDINLCFSTSAFEAVLYLAA